MPSLIKYSAFLSLLVLSLQSSGQSANRKLTNEFSLTVDNDYPFMTDEYYTAGQELSYRFVPKKNLFFKDSSRTILAFNLGSKVFTPNNIDTEDIYLMDRPYCGWTYISLQALNFRRSNSANVFLAEFGLVGPQSGMDEAQQWLHRVINLYGIYGWHTQIVNEFVFNAGYSHVHGFKLSEKAEFVSTSEVKVGTGSNYLSQELTMRFFRFKPLWESAYTNSVITASSSTRKSELFLFISLETNYVFTNIFIEGSLFDNKSPFTTSINHWLFMPKIGIQYSGKRFTGKLSYTHTSKETPYVIGHDYATAAIAFRF